MRPPAGPQSDGGSGKLSWFEPLVVTSHSEKENAAPNYKHGFGLHPLLCFVNGHRFQAFICDSTDPDLSYLKARHAAPPGRAPHSQREADRPGQLPLPRLRQQRRLAGHRAHGV